MDSYEKFADDYFPNNNIELFSKVHRDDIEEIKVKFSLMICDLEYNNNWRIFPANQIKNYWIVANSSCCGQVDLYYKCRSGRAYLYGCNYGH